jgi:hypothetical protein
LMISNIKGREILKINLTLSYIRVIRNKECITFFESWFWTQKRNCLTSRIKTVLIHCKTKLIHLGVKKLGFFY